MAELLELLVKRLSALRLRIDTLRLLPLVLALLAAPSGTVSAAAVEKYAALVIDANTGETLHERYADAPRFPASLTKIMTLYVLFEDLQSGRFKLDSPLSVSANAAAQAPSKVGVKAGSTIKVEDAIQALTTKSANDVSVVVAENVAGSVSAFAARMNRAADAIGMKSTTFRNPNGLPDPNQITTARDLAKLSQAVQDRFPQYYKYFGVRSFTYKGTKYRNHNKLLGSVEGVDGIKTGYTRASGFNLVTSVRRGDRHLIAVVMGGKTGASRDAEMRKLLSRYLPSGKPGDRSPPMLVADSSEADIRLPRPRPGSESETALSYAPVAPSRDLVTAAMAQVAVPEGSATEAGAEPMPDPVAAGSRRRPRWRVWLCRPRRQPIRPLPGLPRSPRSAPERATWSPQKELAAPAIRSRRKPAGTSRSAPFRPWKPHKPSSTTPRTRWVRCLLRAGR
jgi:D-alanyl-D-alanine carboxypeptidase